MSKYKLAIFDMDGTILNTLDDINNTVNVTLNAFDLPAVTIDETRQNVGNGLKKTLERSIKVELSEEKFNEMFAYMLKYYEVHSGDTTRPYEGVREQIARVREAGIRTAVLSNKKDAAVKQLCRVFFEGLFDYELGERDGVRMKPAPDSIFELSKLEAPLEEIVYIGDSNVDVETARNAGVGCVAVTWGFRDEDFLKAQGAKIIAHTPEEMYEYIVAE